MNPSARCVAIQGGDVMLLVTTLEQQQVVYWIDFLITFWRMHHCQPTSMLRRLEVCEGAR
jgi:hypothetical protein